MDLIQISKKIILDNQHSSGAYVACPNFDTYNFSWIRDGSFIAYAMDRIQEHDSAARFHHWVNTTILRQRKKLDTLFAKLEAGQPGDTSEYLPCRYSLQGERVNDGWPNFQLDGYGTWLWSLTEHINKADGAEFNVFEHSVDYVVKYLELLWQEFNSDCWEENPHKIHPSTLACIYGGLKAVNEFLRDETVEKCLQEIKSFLLEHAVVDHRFAKYVGTHSVDASLLWLAVPFGVFDPQDHLVVNTVREIEQQLLIDGGVRRYPEDTYYGGGEWLLLSSWLGWYYVLAGRKQEGLTQAEWVEAQADDKGYLPEQTLNNLNCPYYEEPWLELWGPVATPLLWSHAMYLVLRAELASV